MNLNYPFSNEDLLQEGNQLNKAIQLSEELIEIKDSCNVSVSSTDTKAAISLQASLQLVIAIVISISIASSEKAEKITEDLLQSAKTKQLTRQKIIVENSSDVEVETVDTEIAANIQVLAQILLALIAKLDIA